MGPGYAASVAEPGFHTMINATVALGGSVTSARGLGYMSINPLPPLTPEEIKALVADATPGRWSFTEWDEETQSGYDIVVDLGSDFARPRLRHWTMGRLQPPLLTMPDGDHMSNEDSYRTIEGTGRLAAAAPALAHTALSAIAERDALRAVIVDLVKAHDAQMAAAGAPDPMNYSGVIDMQDAAIAKARAVLGEVTKP